MPKVANSPRVLVTAASRYGSTAEIGEAIARRLSEEGLDVDSVAPERVKDVACYDAIVVGSAVYYGHWLVPATELLRDNAAALAGKPVWLFSSGPIGSRGHELPKGDAVDVAELVELSGARGHRVFPGRLDASRLRLRDRALVRAMRAEEGDVRNWDDVDAFALRIAEALQSSKGEQG